MMLGWTRRSVRRCSDDAGAVGAEHRAVHDANMARKRRADLPAGGGVPESGGTVYGRSDNARAVGAERRAHDAIHAIERCAHLPAGLGIHNRAVLSQDAVMMRVPSRLNAALVTRSVWPMSGSPTGRPVSASHSRAVLSV
jgi:hypothetical protein